MLRVPILCTDREADRGIAALQERFVVPTAAKAIGAAVDHHVEAAGDAAGDAVDHLGERAAGAVVLAAIAAAAHLAGQVLGGANAFGKDADAAGVLHAALADRIADDIVVEHRADLPAALLRGIGEQFGAPQPLFLGREGDVDDRRIELPLRQQARGLQYQRNARGIVVGAGGVVRRVHHVGDAAVDVAADDDDAIGIAAGLDAQHILDHDAIGCARTGEAAADPLDPDAAAAILADRGQLRRHPVACGADAALGVGGG